MNMMILDIYGFMRRIENGKGVGGTVMSIAGTVSIRLAALDIDISAITPCSEVFCISDFKRCHQGVQKGAYGSIRR